MIVSFIFYSSKRSKCILFGYNLICFLNNEMTLYTKIVSVNCNIYEDLTIFHTFSQSAILPHQRIFTYIKLKWIPIIGSLTSNLYQLSVMHHLNVSKSKYLLDIFILSLHYCWLNLSYNYFNTYLIDLEMIFSWVRTPNIYD